jgi:hypothetical protein
VLAPESKLWKKLRSFKLLAAAAVAGNAQQPEAVVSRERWEALHGPCALPGMLQQLDFDVGYHVSTYLPVIAIPLCSVPTLKSRTHSSFYSALCYVA